MIWSGEAMRILWNSFPQGEKNNKAKIFSMYPQWISIPSLKRHPFHLMKIIHFSTSRAYLAMGERRQSFLDVRGVPSFNMQNYGPNAASCRNPLTFLRVKLKKRQKIISPLQGANAICIWQAFYAIHVTAHLKAAALWNQYDISILMSEAILNNMKSMV